MCGQVSSPNRYVFMGDTRAAQVSGIRIDREGLWFYEDNEIQRRDIVRFFCQNLHQDNAGGYFIEIGAQRCHVRVEDTIYTVWAVYRDHSDECIRLLLSDDSVEELDPKTLRVGLNNILYCKVKGARFDARFSSSAYYRLADHIEYDPLRDAYYLPLKGKIYYIAET